MATTQANLNEYGSVPVASASRGSDTVYYVKWSNELKRWICTNKEGAIGCEHERYRGKHPESKPCRHIQEYLLDRLRSRVKVLEKRFNQKAHAVFQTFEQVVDRFEASNNEEVAYLANIALSFAFTEGSVVSDDVYEAVDGKFNTTGAMGITFRILKDKGLIEGFAWEKSRTPTNHGALIRRWRLTEDGRAAFKGVWGR